MILYHGSHVEVRNPQLLQNQRELDFGKGFYTTTDFEQAKAWARRTAKIRKSAEACVNIYMCEEEPLKSLHMLKFEEPDARWLHYVAANRRGEAQEENYDLILGPVANDQTMPVLILYLDGYLTEDEAIARLLPQKLKDQIVFKTERALTCLHCTEVIKV